jgi:hypothetical protein
VPPAWPEVEAGPAIHAWPVRVELCSGAIPGTEAQVMDEQRPWHRLFALSWMDFFRGTPVTVEPEKDLSVKKQLLDVLLLHKGPGPLNCRLPDGFEEFANYNLVTFKSYQEKLSVWTLMELLGHYVNLRKQVSPSMNEDDLLPEEEFRLYAVCARYPQQLASQNVEMRPLSEGVYEVRALTARIRIIVANQLPRHEHNAMLHLFSTKAELMVYGVQHYQIRSGETSTLLLQLYRKYQREGQIMPDMLEEFARETIDELLKELPVEKRLQGLTPEQIVRALTPEQVVHGLSVDQLLQGLDAEKLRELREKLKGNGPPAKPE